MAASLAVAGSALAHELDHPAPTGSTPAPLSSTVNAGGENAQWELVTTIPTGNPQTDLDFFTVKGLTYMSVGSLAAGPNSAGQNIIQLTNEDGEVDPHYVTGHPSATCPKATSSATGLQHDPEASPKGDALMQWPNPYVDRRDTQIVIDATDATGRCHDQGVLGVAQAPQGGLEIIDVTDPANPVEIGLTTHVGQAHTVNVDPKRPHIAYVSSSDSVNYPDGQQRANDEGSSLAMDGIEVVDMSSCMNFPAGTTVAQKRDACRPAVYRYRWPDVDFARSSTFRATGACHELEIYPDDRLTCAALHATLLLDMSGAFDDRGTPTDFSDDRLRGTALPCAVRDSSTAAAVWATTAKVTDCVVGEVNGEAQDLRVSSWRKMSPPPSLTGVKKIGAAHHMGFENQARENLNPPYDATEDIFVSHEAELTQSGRFILASDERGGGVLPVGASCTPGADNVRGNGGIHAFPVSKLGAKPPEPEGANEQVEAYQERIYAKTSKKERAIFRAPISTEPQGALCTAHVFQQIPGQNRIFMGWYSQGTQVIDFTENADGTIDFKQTGYFIPEHANTWTSHIFKVEQNRDGSFTYWGATGDFLLGDGGRNAVDVYKVTLPGPKKPAGKPAAGTPTYPVANDPPSCAGRYGFYTVKARATARRKRVRFSFVRNGDAGARVQVFRQSKGRRVTRKKVADFRNRKKAFTWRARGARNGYYTARYIMTAPNGSKDVRHVALRRRGGKFFKIPYFDHRGPCAFVRYVSVGRPVFGGKKNARLKMTLRLAEPGEASFTIRRGGKVVKRVKERSYPRGKSRVVVRLPRKAKRGQYRITLDAKRPGKGSGLSVFSRYL